MSWEIKFYILAIVLLVIGGLYWGSIGLFSYNPLTDFNNRYVGSSTFVNIVYVLVGISAIYVGFKSKDVLNFEG